jgi:hypothetical protein
MEDKSQNLTASTKLFENVVDTKYFLKMLTNQNHIKAD